MPTYEYKCEACAHQFEVFARMSDPDPETCEACGAGPLVKVLFPVAVHYKGSGFYSTDYNAKKSGTSSEKSTSESSSSSSDSSGSGSTSSSDSSSGSSDSSGSTSSSGSSGASSGDA